MLPEPPGTDPEPRTRLKPWHLAALATLAGALIVGGAFWGGFEIATFRQKQLFQREATNETLLGGLGRSDIPRAEWPALMKLYGFAPDEEARLDGISWVPPARPAPFVGHTARPGRSANATINTYGFRDEREGYLPKPAGVYRVFVTGGSTAYGSGAPSQAETIPGFLERFLNGEQTPRTGRRYEVVNTAFPGWLTSQERILIENRLVDLAPDRIIMFSGNNDMLWAFLGENVNWSFGYADRFFLSLLNLTARRAGYPELADRNPGRIEFTGCAPVAARSARNVALAAQAAAAAGARLVFALQPNILSTAKALSPRERNARARAPFPDRWADCYDAFRQALAAPLAAGYRFVDASRAFAEMPIDDEIFIDYSHFAGPGNAAIARLLMEALEW